MAIPLNDNIKVDAPKPSDPRFFNPNNTPWASVEAVEAGIPLTERHPELRVDIMGVIYWWKNGAWILESDDTKLDKGNFVGTAETLNTKIDSILANSTVVNEVTTSSSVPPTGNIHALGIGPGTYPNWGGMVIPANNIGTLQRVDGVYSVNLMPITLPTADTVPWTNVTGYASGVDRTHLGKLWKSNAATATTDIPGTSSKWVEVLNGYGKEIKNINSNLTLKADLFPKKNRFNYADPDILRGKYFEADGSIGIYHQFSISGFIPVTVGESVFSNKNTTAFNPFFDVNKNLITTNITNTAVSVVPVGAVYQRRSLNISVSDDISLSGCQIEEGISATDYEPYALEVKESQLNLSALKTKADLVVGKNLFNYADPDILTDCFFDEFGVIVKNFPGFIISGYLPVETGKNYICNKNSLAVYNVFFDESKRLINSNITNAPISIAPVGAVFYRRTVPLPLGNDIAFENIQIEEGIVSTTFEPYALKVKESQLDLSKYALKTDIVSSQEVVNGFNSTSTQVAGSANNDRVLNQKIALKAEISDTTTINAKFDDYTTTNALLSLNNQLNTKIDAVSSGSPKGVYPNLAALISTFPSGNSNVYITADNGHWNYFNTTWQSGGVYAANAVAGTRIIDAYTYGFSPLQTGENNSIAINNALALGGKIIVSIPGVYEIDDSIILPSNTTIEFVKGCTLKHIAPNTARFVNTFKNKGCIDSTSNDNISIIGNGLILDFNGRDGVEGYVFAPFAYQNGRLSFYKVTNFEVSGIYVNDPQESYNMYFFELTNCAFGKINDINLKRYPKDGIDFIHCHDIHIKNYRSTTGDDAIFMGSGWINYDKTIGDTYNITIENWICDTIFRGVPSRIITTSWDDWESGRTYIGSYDDASELCVNAGRVYRKITNGNQVASNAPTHSTGTVTGADGIGWLVVSDIVKYTNDVYNIRYINCQVVGADSLFLWAYESPTFLQNTNMALLDDLAFNDCVFESNSKNSTASFSSFVNASCNIGTMDFNDCKVDFKENILNLGYNTFITIQQNSMNNKIVVDKISINNLKFKGEYKVGRLISNTGGLVEVNTINIIESSIELANTNDAVLISVSNQSCVKNVNIVNSTIKNIAELLFFEGSNWFDAPIERVVNTVNSKFINCNEIYTHQYSYPNAMVIYYNAFGCQFIDTQNWIINNEQGNASTMVVNFSGNTTNTPLKVIQNANNVTKKMLDLPAGTFWVNNTNI